MRQCMYLSKLVYIWHLLPMGTCIAPSFRSYYKYSHGESCLQWRCFGLITLLRSSLITQKNQMAPQRSHFGSTIFFSVRYIINLSQLNNVLCMTDKQGRNKQDTAWKFMPLFILKCSCLSIYKTHPVADIYGISVIVPHKRQDVLIRIPLSSDPYIRGNKLLWNQPNRISEVTPCLS